MQSFVLSRPISLESLQLTMESMVPDWYRTVRHRLLHCFRMRWGSDTQIESCTQMSRDICIQYCNRIGIPQVRDYYTACYYSYMEATREHGITINLPLPKPYQEDRINIRFEISELQGRYADPAIKTTVLFPHPKMWMYIGGWAANCTYRAELGSQKVQVDEQMGEWSWRIVNAFAAMELAGIGSLFYHDGASDETFK